MLHAPPGPRIRCGCGCVVGLLMLLIWLWYGDDRGDALLVRNRNVQASMSQKSPVVHVGCWRQVLTDIGVREVQEPNRDLAKIAYGFRRPERLTIGKCRTNAVHGFHVQG